MLAQEFELVITRDDWFAAAEVILEEVRKADVPPIELDSAFYCSHCAIGRKANHVFPGLFAEFIYGLDIGLYSYYSMAAMDLAASFDEFMDALVEGLPGVTPEFPVTLKFELVEWQ